MNFWEAARASGASDIHAVTDQPLMLRIDGELLQNSKAPLPATVISEALRMILTEAQWTRFLQERAIDVSHVLSDGTRFRINCHFVSGAPAFAARLVPKDIPTVHELKIPSVVMDLCRAEDGMVLFTGPTGCGKSTSLAAILHARAQEESLNIITLEDPIEFLIPRGQGIIRQQELGADFPSFPEGLKHVLRQDPDIVMVGEMRDPESIALALSLAETGHLVLATLHTPNTIQSIDRIVDAFPPHQQTQVRLQLSLALRAVIGQRLLPRKDGGRIANREILIRTAAVANIIREHRLAELETVLQTGGDEGMCSFEQDLKRLIGEGQVEKV